MASPVGSTQKTAPWIHAQGLTTLSAESDGLANERTLNPRPIR